MYDEAVENSFKMKEQIRQVEEKEQGKLKIKLRNMKKVEE